ncbi:hypothetical protein PLESTF_000510300 [Pleodorina starrii]|nr:hypothetical protein PLESTF_000510300 [Pleodorina starrii]
MQPVVWMEEGEEGGGRARGLGYHRICVCRGGFLVSPGVVWEEVWRHEEERLELLCLLLRRRVLLFLIDSTVVATAAAVAAGVCAGVRVCVFGQQPASPGGRPHLPTHTHTRGDQAGWWTQDDCVRVRACVWGGPGG